jgi:hypothetical protein
MRAAGARSRPGRRRRSGDGFQSRENPARSSTSREDGEEGRREGGKQPGLGPLPEPAAVNRKYSGYSC